ncbi:MAG: CoA transferase, partial [Chloroflexota bacterium]|nr:CoA transferase [Chloroflexota bacterium]
QTGGGATWDTIADFFGDPQLKEPKFADPAQRIRNTVELDQVVLESIEERGKWDLFTKAAEARMLFGLVQTPSELLECPQLESRDFYRDIEHPVIGKVKVPAALFNLSLTPYHYTGPAPTLGQNNSEIYVDGLEYSQEDFVRLRQLDVI